MGTVITADLLLAGSYSERCTPMHDQRVRSRDLECSWGEIEPRQRRFLIAQCGEAAKWASANLHRMNPWEFLAKLEHHKFG